MASWGPSHLDQNKQCRRISTVLSCIIAILVCCGLVASETVAEPAHHPVNLTLYYPVGTNKDPDIDTNFRLSLIYGRVGSVHGVDLNTGVSIIQRDLRGFQATLLYSQLEGEFRGVALTGLVNYFRAESRGIQVAGLVNVVRGRFAGLQYAALFNFTQSGFSGIQLSSVFNTNHGDGGFLQVAGVTNMNEGSFRGVQLGAINLTADRLVGAQLGVVNMAVRAKGFMGGLINIAGETRGLQIAPLNIIRRNYGVPIGLINIDEDNGGEDWITFGSNLAAVNTGMRTTVNRFYSMFTVGYGDLQGDVENTAFLSWHYGYAIPLGRKWSLDVDLGFVHIMPKNSDDPNQNDRLHFAVQARALAEIRFSRKVAVLGGVGISSIYSEYSSNATQKTEPLGVLGISLF